MQSAPLHEVSGHWASAPHVDAPTLLRASGHSPPRTVGRHPFCAPECQRVPRVSTFGRSTLTRPHSSATPAGPAADAYASPCSSASRRDLPAACTSPRSDMTRRCSHATAYAHVRTRAHARARILTCPTLHHGHMVSSLYLLPWRASRTGTGFAGYSASATRAWQ